MLEKGGVILLYFYFFCTFALMAQEQETITAIEFKGLVTVGAESLRPKLQSQLGHPYSRAAINEDIKRLYNLKIFSHISVNEEITPEGVRLIFIVVENQLLSRIDIRGNREISEEEIKKELKLTENQYLSAHLLSLDKYRLTEIYRKKGYMFAKVNTKTREEGGWSIITLDIDEGPRVTVEEIIFVGNETFDKGDLLEYTKTEENGWFTSSIFDAEVFAEDLIFIRNYYRAEGFLDVQIEVQDLYFSDDRTELTIKIGVKEGTRYQIRNLKIEGNRLFTNDEIRHRLALKEDGIFRQIDMAEDQKKIEQLYAENSFIAAQVTPKVHIPELKGNKVDITYEIKENKKIYINKVNITGNTLTRDEVIRRELTILPNETANIGKIQESQGRLSKLQYFESIKIDLEETGVENRRDLFFNVEEGKTGALRFAAGVTSDLGAVGEISFTKSNFDLADLPKSFADLFSGDAFTGAGQNFQVYFQLGEDLFRFRTSFVEPYLFGHNLILGISLFDTRRGRESFIEDRLGTNIALGRRLSRNTILRLTYRYEIIKVGDVDESAPEDVRAVSGTNNLSGMGIEIETDTLDDPIVPSTGYNLGLSYELTGVALGGDFDFSRINARATWFHPVFTTSKGWKHVIKIGGRVGFEWEHPPSNYIPIFERFYAGGFDSLRGFEFRSISPKDPSSGDPIGGNALFLTTFEYYIPVYQDIFRVVIFTDVGTVTKDISKDMFDTLRVSVGAGIRIKIPFLGPRPFAVDFGFPMLKQKDDDEQMVSFSIGKAF